MEFLRKWYVIVPGTPGMRGAPHKGFTQEVHWDPFQAFRSKTSCPMCPQGKADENGQPGRNPSKGDARETVGSGSLETAC